MSNYKLVYTKQAQKDAKKAASSGFKPKIEGLLDIIKEKPFAEYPPYEKFVGNLEGAYSRRINIRHRLVCQVLEEEKIVKIIRMWKDREEMNNSTEWVKNVRRSQW